MQEFPFSENITCPSCGTVNPSTNRFCRQCGRLLPRPAPPPPPPFPATSSGVGPEKQTRQSGFGCATLVTVALIMLVLGMAIGYFLALYFGL